MAAIFQKTFSNTLDIHVWIAIKISLKFVTKRSINNIPALIGSDNGLAPARRQAIIWTNDILYASLGLNG